MGMITVPTSQLWGLNEMLESMVLLTEPSTGYVFSEQELLAFEVNLRHQGPASHLSLGEGVGLCRKTARGGGRHSYFGESCVYACFLGYQ